MFMVNSDRNVEFVSDNVVNYLQFTPVRYCHIIHCIFQLYYSVIIKEFCAFTLSSDVS